MEYIPYRILALKFCGLTDRPTDRLIHSIHSFRVIDLFDCSIDRSLVLFLWGLRHSGALHCTKPFVYCILVFSCRSCFALFFANTDSIFWGDSFTLQSALLFRCVVVLPCFRSCLAGSFSLAGSQSGTKIFLGPDVFRRVHARIIGIALLVVVLVAAALVVVSAVLFALSAAAAADRPEVKTVDVVPVVVPVAKVVFGVGVAAVVVVVVVANTRSRSPSTTTSSTNINRRRWCREEHGCGHCLLCFVCVCLPVRVCVCVRRYFLGGVVSL
mmetsp:Transcript_2506/g.5613  ORF Transcript_2506/g.5613 Transcript_2506/m.5613 type:complete len:270 (+) Transcript_2506:248-1057(+)